MRQREKMSSTSQGQKPRADSPSQPSAKTNPADTLTSDSWPPGPRENILLWFKAAGLWDLLRQSWQTNNANKQHVREQSPPLGLNSRCT